jgi:hypothetical protein
MKITMQIEGLSDDGKILYKTAECGELDLKKVIPILSGRLLDNATKIIENKLLKLNERE